MVTWQNDFFAKANAEKVYEELRSLGDTYTPQQVVDFARDENTELHKCFEWDDTRAANLYRLQQARKISCNLVYVDPQDNSKPSHIRVYQRSEEDKAYKGVVFTLKNETEYDSLLKRAYSELQSFKQRYQNLVELAPFISLIEEQFGTAI